MQKEAVEWYVSGEGMYVNELLRGKLEGMTDADKHSIDALKNATNKGVVDKDVLYRSVDAEAVFGQMTQSQYENLLEHIAYGESNKFTKPMEKRAKEVIGKTINEKGFMSTTVNEHMALEWNGMTGSSKDITLELHGAKGRKGLDLTNHFMDQGEVLLPPNAKYTVKKVTSKNGVIKVIGQFNN